jgi:hypothetical protein
MFENGVWRIWYGGGQEFDVEDGKQYPKYNIRYTESIDGIKLNDDYTVVIDTADADEHRVGRPYVIKHADKYLMFSREAENRRFPSCSCRIRRRIHMAAQRR